MMHNLPHDLTLLRDLSRPRPRVPRCPRPEAPDRASCCRRCATKGSRTGERGERMHAPSASRSARKTRRKSRSRWPRRSSRSSRTERRGFLRDKAGPIHDRDESASGTEPQPFSAFRSPSSRREASTRMGEAKQLLDVGGESMLRRAVHGAIASRAGEVIVVIGASAGEIAEDLAELPVRVVENRDWQSGIASSVVAAVVAAETSGRTRGRAGTRRPAIRRRDAPSPPRRRRSARATRASSRAPTRKAVACRRRSTASSSAS